MSIKRFIEEKLSRNHRSAEEQYAGKTGFSLNLNGEEFSCRLGETVLEALIRQKVDIPYACRQQVCQSCLMRSLNGAPPPDAQQNLRDTLKKLDYFLACACVPTRNMEIALMETITKEVPADVAQIEYLNADVMSIFLQCEQPLDYHAGQTIILMNEEKIGKSYHITSASSEKESGTLEIHVPLIAGSYFSEWLHQDLTVGDRVYVCGPMGSHFYSADTLQQPLLMMADGYGLSPLVGILQDALEAGHNGPIFLFHSAKTAQNLYLVDDLQELGRYCSNLAYYPSTILEQPPYLTGNANTLALQTLPDLSNFRVYICGPSHFVRQAQKEVYLSGASTKEIYSIFLPQ